MREESGKSGVHGEESVCREGREGVRERDWDSDGWKGFGERRQKKKWEGFGERRWRKGKVAEERAEQAGLGKKPLVTGSAQLIDNKHKIIVIGYNFNKCSTLYFLCLWDKAPVTWHFQCTQGQWTFKWTSPILVPGWPG